jgi:Fe-S-cluster containining protein
MIPPVFHKNASSKRDILSQFASRLKTLFEKMDHEYETISGKYGFECRGCEDNCCRTRFHHHTFIEYYYIRKGFEILSREQQQRIRRTASTVDQIHSIAGRKEQSAKEMCPLNLDGRCILYSYRPMICRLHGIPHELHRPGKAVQNHPGCNAFYIQCRQPLYIRFDRTPYYIEMSALERDLKSALGISERIKMTVAQMLLT